MKPVIQKERTGCGIASVAALAGVSYDRAKAEAHRLGIFAKDRRLWSDAEYVRTLLRAFGISAVGKEQRFVTWEKLPDRALLAVKWHLEKGTPFWHWVVFAREGKSLYVLDSKKGLKENKRTDFGRMKPKWYISVNS
jgi:ABC-type bacteriocin/lantibiotic exporter with double-glycine peptidase domain